MLLRSASRESAAVCQCRYLYEIVIAPYLVLCGNFAILVYVYGNETERIDKQDGRAQLKGDTYSTFFCSATFLRIGVSILHGLHQL